ncbi:hypothetical protein BT96DRAFT_302081 [Gymnopus androsaceus JB14]|uniref:Uncharacterized protein n=1 Tax=Gymnopus androsaceus JB14 TaxID=1447944 RepID=A0A6A4H2N8_9AGAR|nr:hypothetical protein BT96DRAFT_302081 [Gymnopus androsaceus JB14]
MRQSLSDCLHNKTILARIDGFIIDQSLRWVWSSPGQLHLYPYGNSKDCDGAIPYDLTTLPSTKIQFLSYEWMTRSLAEVDCDYSTVFVEIARSVGKELKQLYLQDAHSYDSSRTVPSRASICSKSLAVFMPLLETLCLQKMSYLPIKLRC